MEITNIRFVSVLVWQNSSFWWSLLLSVPHNRSYVADFVPPNPIKNNEITQLHKLSVFYDSKFWGIYIYIEFIWGEISLPGVPQGVLNLICKSLFWMVLCDIRACQLFELKNNFWFLFYCLFSCIIFFNCLSQSLSSPRSAIYSRYCHYL